MASGVTAILGIDQPTARQPRTLSQATENSRSEDGPALDTDQVAPPSSELIVVWPTAVHAPSEVQETALSPGASPIETWDHEIASAVRHTSAESSTLTPTATHEVSDAHETSVIVPSEPGTSASNQLNPPSVERAMAGRPS